MKVPEAWALPLPAGGAAKGAGILIGQPDTGWHPHPDVNAAVEINTALGWNTLDLLLPWDRHKAIDPLQGFPFEFNRGHGTTCASVAVSRGSVTAFDSTKGMSGTDLDGNRTNRVAGVAPAATIVPIRCTNQVAILETVNPAFERALYYAIYNANVDVISCSLGVAMSATPPPSLLALVQAARARNIIFVAASAQQDWNFIPAPASLPGVFAVTGSTRDGGHVGNSDSGSFAPAKIAIAAPALDIYEASFGYDSSDSAYPIRERLPSPATSFATAQFAGVVALWLAHHGKQNLLVRYPHTPLYDVLSALLPKSVTVPPGWDRRNWGPGIINAAALLSQPLPNL